VDDAIVVVEAVEHHVEHGLSPRDAAIKAMDEVSGPVIAVGLVLTAVFVPCAFISGIVGQFFRQFALTIAISTVISAFNSLTLSPALAALLIRPRGARRDPLTWVIDLLLGWFFRLFNSTFRLTTRAYTGVVGVSLRLALIVLVLYGGLIGLTYWGYLQLPTGFIPSQDKGYLLASVQLPDAASVGRTKEVIRKLEKIALSTPGVKNTNSVAGNSFMLSAYGSNFGSMFIILKNFDERRHDPAQGGNAIMARLIKQFQAEVPEAQVNIFPPPAVSGLGRAGGFKYMVEDRSEGGLKTLQGQTMNLIEKGNQQPGLTGLFTVFKVDSPQLFVDVNRQECASQGVDPGDLFATLQIYLGSRYVNDLNLFGRTWSAVVQADARFRNDVSDIKKLKVRNNRGGMVPLGALLSVRDISGPLVLTRYNMYPAAAIQGNLAPGVSSGEAMSVMEQLAARELPTTMAAEWTELFFIEKQSGGTGMWVFACSVVFVFLVLAALYESWALPLAVILVVPMCVLGSITGVWLAKQDINIFTQVGFVVLVGLACKNAILIVEFAKLKRDEGVPRREAALAACRLRFRPIVMTSFAFILGVVPLLFATGAGAEMRQALGTAVFAGMLGVTLFGVFLTPVFYVVIDWVVARRLFSAARFHRMGEWLRDVLTLAAARRRAYAWLSKALEAKPGRAAAQKGAR
jgi:multidrug efflux pump